LETKPAARAAIRSCRTEQSPREVTLDGTLKLKKIGVASLADRRQELLKELANDLAEEVKRHWLATDKTTNWPARVQEEQQAALLPKLAATNETDGAAPPVVLPMNDASPLMLRGRFDEHMSLEFTNIVLDQIQRQLAALNDRGRPRLIARDAKLIADMARDAIHALIARAPDKSKKESRFAGSPILQKLAVEGSRRVLAEAVETFDYKQPERFLPVGAIDEIVRTTCFALLDESAADPQFRAAIATLMPLDDALARTIEHANTDLLQCGCDRRTLVFVPKDQPNTPAAYKLHAERPLAALVSVEVDDIVVVTEDTGISPRSLALRLEQVFPGIADAARRLLTRIDVDWKNLV
jgi:hypothetical protein